MEKAIQPDVIGSTLFKEPKERPILFSTDMVKAILNGSKTQTRRKVKMTKTNLTNAKFGFTAFTPEGHISVRAKHENGEFGESFIKSPYGLKGDLLWVRESFAIWHSPEPTVRFKADVNTDEQKVYKWKPSIHMPKKDARIWLQITDVRVERLQDVSEEDAKAEGVSLHNRGKFYFNYTPKYEEVTQMVYDCWSAKDSFNTLWKAINGCNNWQENPWVWVVKFSVISKKGMPETQHLKQLDLVEEIEKTQAQ